MEFLGILEVASIFMLVYAAALFQAYFFCKFSGRNLEYSCYFSKNEAFEGDKLYIVETICNHKKLPVLYLKAELTTSKWLDFAGPKSVVTHNDRFVTSSFMLKGGQKVIRKWPLKCLKRGIYGIDNIMLVWGDLLGMKSEGRPAASSPRLIVYPSPANLEQILNGNYILGDLIVKRWINDDPFIISGVREYHSSDPMNKIHWSSTAKSGSLMVRRNDYTSQPSLAIILNIQSTENDFGSIFDEEAAEFGISIAAALTDKAAKHSIPFKFASNAPSLYNSQKQCLYMDEGLGIKHASLIMECLAHLELKIARDFDTFLVEAPEFMRNSDAVFISPYVNEHLITAAKSIKLGGRSSCIIALGHVDSKYFASGIDIYTPERVDAQHAV